MRPSQLLSPLLQAELLRLYNQDPEWMYTFKDPERPGGMRLGCKAATMLRDKWEGPTDMIATYLLSRWLGEGPKVFRPTPEQTEALLQIEVGLTVEEVSLPYETLMVELSVGPFKACILHKTPTNTLLCYLMSQGHTDDISTILANQATVVEDGLKKFHPDAADLEVEGHKAMRVACNAVLALTSYEHHLRLLFPKEYEADRRLARERTERGERARQRVKQAVQVVEFTQEVKLHTTEGSSFSPGEGTGASVTPHWRRGHWVMQAHGPQFSLRKRILRKPVLVRKDLFIGNVQNTSATYK